MQYLMFAFVLASLLSGESPILTLVSLIRGLGFIGLLVAFSWVAGVHQIPAQSLGLVEKRWSYGGKIAAAGTLARDGEAGLQSVTLGSGFHIGYWPWQYRIHKVEVESRLSLLPKDPLGDAQMFDMLDAWDPATSVTHEPSLAAESGPSPRVVCALNRRLLIDLASLHILSVLAPVEMQKSCGPSGAPTSLAHADSSVCAGFDWGHLESFERQPRDDERPWLLIENPRLSGWFDRHRQILSPTA
ncbi:MAG: hypothetical protein ACI841_004042 [Planctomycetota bacterium]|jgi:hypothetical protein